MQPQDLIRQAAKLIETQGWAYGTHPEWGSIAAFNSAGEPVRLLATTTGDARTKVNPAAYSFSIYGALVKAQELYGEPPHLGLMWRVLYDLAEQIESAPAGGNNYVHPVIRYNEADGRTKEEVIAFLNQAAAAIDAKLNPPAAVAS